MKMAMEMEEKMEMEEEIEEEEEIKLMVLKHMLHTLVVSSRKQINVRTLHHQYCEIFGRPLPFAKYGCRDSVIFLRMYCSDYLRGNPSNPVVTAIKLKPQKFICQMIQKQKIRAEANNKKKASAPKSGIDARAGQDNFQMRETPNTNVTSSMFDTNASASCVETITKGVSNVDSQVKENENSSVEENACALVEDISKVAKDRYADYGRLTSSSNSNTYQAQLEELKCEIYGLIGKYENGIWCRDLIPIYRRQYGRELNFSRFGYMSILSMLYSMKERVSVSRPVNFGDWRLRVIPQPPAARRALPAAAPPTPAAAAPHWVPPSFVLQTLAQGQRRVPHRTRPFLLPHTPFLFVPPAPHLSPRAGRPQPVVEYTDDALPGVNFDPDVFPADCMNLSDFIPALSPEGLRPGAAVPVIVAEVYSPSHFWIILLGDNYNVAMDDMFEKMNEYYGAGPGRNRRLPHAGVCVGHYCAALYERDWHRVVIVQLLEANTVKVRYVDYGTVDTVPVGSLRPLLRCWATLPAQALRARLAAVRPYGKGFRWHHVSSTHFLNLVSEKRLVANIVGVDKQDDSIEMFLIDTNTEKDVCMTTELVKAGYADRRNDSALKSDEWYLYPKFAALEAGVTPNFGEIGCYLRDGINPDYVKAYYRYVPTHRTYTSPGPPNGPPTPRDYARSPRGY